MSNNGISNPNEHSSAIDNQAQVISLQLCLRNNACGNYRQHQQQNKKRNSGSNAGGITITFHGTTQVLKNSHGFQSHFEQQKHGEFRDVVDAIKI